MKTVAFIRSTNIYDDSRATKEILALIEGGYRLVVFGWNRNGDAEKKTRQLFKDKEIEFRFFDCPLQNGIGIRNINKLLGWIEWTKKGLKSIRELYAVHACNLDGGMGAYYFCKKHHIPLVYDIYDYYVDSHDIPNQLNAFIESLEIKIINFANITIICTEERKEQIEKSNPKRLLVVHNSPDVPNLEPVEAKYDYSYCGSLCDLRLIKEVIAAYKDHTDLRFAFAGNDILKKDVEKIANQFSNFEFFGTIPYSKVLEIESQAKVLSAIYKPSIRNHRLSAPNKFYEALALGKPIIVCRGTGIDRIVQEKCLGIVIDYSANAFYRALRELLNSPEEMSAMGRRGRQLYETKYKWSIMKQSLLKEYNNLGF